MARLASRFAGRTSPLPSSSGLVEAIAGLIIGVAFMLLTAAVEQRPR